LIAEALEFTSAKADNAPHYFGLLGRSVMFLRKFVAAAAAVFLGITLAQVDAAARGFGGGHGGFHGAFGHGGYAGHGFYGHGFAHSGHHDAHHDMHGQHWAMHGFEHWSGHGGDGRFRHWQPGHWQTSSGFGDHGHWSHLEGVWSR
jgi:hypothetical protein